MPQLGETVVEGTITKWLKKEGETVERDEPLFEISTDKVDTEVPSPVGGKVVSIKVPEGETVSVGTELAVIESGDGQAAPAPKKEGEPAQANAPEAPADPANRESKPEERPEPAPLPEPKPAASTPPSPRAQAAPPPAAQAAPERGPRSQILSPLVRRLAEENQVDLSRVQGTGTGGRSTKKDIQTYIESGQAAPAAAPAAQPRPAEAPAAPPREVPAPAAAPA